MAKNRRFKWALFGLGCAAVATLIVVSAKGGDDQSAGSGSDTTADQTVATGEQPDPAVAIISNGHELGVSDPATAVAEAPATSFAQLTDRQPEELQDRFTQVFNALHDLDAAEVQGDKTLNCPPTAEAATRDFITALQASQQPLTDQLYAIRDAKLDALAAQGFIRSPQGDETPVLPLLKAEKFTMSWDATCAFFNGNAAITATPEMTRMKSVPRSNPDELYLKVPVTRTLVLRSVDTTMPLPDPTGSDQLMFTSSWLFFDGHWTMASYIPQSP